MPIVLYYCYIIFLWKCITYVLFSMGTMSQQTFCSDFLENLKLMFPIFKKIRIICLLVYLMYHFCMLLLYKSIFLPGPKKTCVVVLLVIDLCLICCYNNTTIMNILQWEQTDNLVCVLLYVIVRISYCLFPSNKMLRCF